ncbi:MAG: hypothetical protein WEC59_02615 [Salibacteraceae bacterium]
MGKDNSTLDEIKDLMLNKCRLKQQVYQSTKESFGILKEQLNEIGSELTKVNNDSPGQIDLEIVSQGEFEVKITIAGDTIVFHMHTNVFAFPPSHMVHRSPYIMKNPNSAYCGVINIYNFLADSFRYHRLNDTGYLIGRIFVNSENHFFVEGKQHLGYRFNDFAAQKVSEAQLRNILEAAIKYSMSFDLFTPPYNAVDQVSLSDIIELNNHQKIKTAKRLGFKFQHSEDSKVDF